MPPQWFDETKRMEKGQGNIKYHSHHGVILNLTNCLNHKGHLILLIVRGEKKSDTVKIGIKWSNKKWRTSKYLVLASRPKHHSSEMSTLHHHGLDIYIYALQSSTEEVKRSTIQYRQELTSFKWRMYAKCCRHYISTHSIYYKVLYLA